MRKRNVRAAIAAALCMTVLAAGCGKKADDPVFTGDKTEAPVYQANLDAIKSSAYASVDNLDLEPGTYISVIGRGSSTPYWNQVKAGVEQAATDLNTALGYSGNDKVKVLYSAPDENDNIDQQVNILDEELARYPDVIAISSVDASACSVQFDLAIENGIPIVAFDSGNSYQNIQSTCKRIIQKRQQQEQRISVRRSVTVGRFCCLCMIQYQILRKSVRQELKMNLQQIIRM